MELIARGDARRMPTDRRREMAVWMSALAVTGNDGAAPFAIYRDDTQYELRLYPSGKDPLTVPLGEAVDGVRPFPVWLAPPPVVFIDGLAEGGVE